MRHLFLFLALALAAPLISPTDAHAAPPVPDSVTAAPAASPYGADHKLFAFIGVCEGNRWTDQRFDFVGLPDCKALLEQHKPIPATVRIGIKLRSELPAKHQLGADTGQRLRVGDVVVIASVQQMSIGDGPLYLWGKIAPRVARGRHACILRSNALEVAPHLLCHTHRPRSAS